MSNLPEAGATQGTFTTTTPFRGSPPIPGSPMECRWPWCGGIQTKCLGDPDQVSCGRGAGLALAHRGISGRRGPGQRHAYCPGSRTAERRAGILLLRHRSMTTRAKWAATA